MARRNYYRDFREHLVNWAICFKVRPEEDIFIAKRKSPGLDPSAHPPGMESLEVTHRVDWRVADQRSAAMALHAGVSAA